MVPPSSPYPRKAQTRWETHRHTHAYSDTEAYKHIHTHKHIRTHTSLVSQEALAWIAQRKLEEQTVAPF